MHGSIAEMSAASRREKIVSLINARGRVHIAELVTMLGVSEVTIRHDLADLEEEEKLYRVYGGAEPVKRL